MKPSTTMKVVRSPDLPAALFGVRNGNVSVQKLPVKYEAPKPTRKAEVKTFKMSIKSDGKSVLRSISKKNKVNVCNNARSLRL